MFENIINEIKKGLPSKLDEKAKEPRDFGDFTNIRLFIKHLTFCNRRMFTYVCPSLLSSIRGEWNLRIVRRVSSQIIKRVNSEELTLRWTRSRFLRRHSERI